MNISRDCYYNELFWTHSLVFAKSVVQCIISHQPTSNIGYRATLQVLNLYNCIFSSWLLQIHYKMQKSGILDIPYKMTRIALKIRKILPTV